MSRDKNVIVMRNGNIDIRFDIAVKSERGALVASYIEYRNPPELQGGIAVQEGSKISVEKVHDLLGHSHEDKTWPL